MNVFPKALQQLTPLRLGITWSDGHESSFEVRHLRLQCPCAHCVDEWTQEKILDERLVPQDVRPTKIETVGRYALQFYWSDRHDTGIYAFPTLRKLCECPQCQKT